MSFNLESKKTYIESLQKTAAKLCMRSCFNEKMLGVNQQCLDTCFDKFTQTAAVVHDVLKETCLDSGSIYSHKFMLEESPVTSLKYGEALVPFYQWKGPYYQAKDRMSDKMR